MNICLLPSTFLPLIGGLEIIVHNLAMALSTIGHNVHLVTPYPRFRKIVDNYQYNTIRFGFKGCGRFKLTTAAAILTLSHVVKRHKIDIIHAHNVYRAGSWAYFFSKINPNIPIIGTPHGDDIQVLPEIQHGARLNPKIDKIVRRNLAKFTYITAISPSIRRDICDLVDDKRKIFDVPNGVWVNNFQQKNNIVSVRKRFGIPLDSTVIISIGRNHPSKGFKDGLMAVSNLKKSGYNVTYLLVGRYMESIMEMAKALSVSDCIVTPGQVDSNVVAELLQSSDIYLSSSVIESFGIATLEAMSAGIPCVVTNISGSRDLVSPSYGVLVPPKDPEQTSKAIEHLINNPSIRKKMGQLARIEATKYDWTNIAKKYLKIYSKSLTSRPIS